MHYLTIDHHCIALMHYINHVLYCQLVYNEYILHMDCIWHDGITHISEHCAYCGNSNIKGMVYKTWLT